jgi:hypothetical protein
MLTQIHPIKGLAFRSTNSVTRVTSTLNFPTAVVGYRPPQRFGPNGYAPRLIVKVW